MLFSSYSFIFCFLPLSIWGFFKCSARFGRSFALAYLCLSSLVFYASSMGFFVAVLILSIGFNYSFGLYLEHHKRRSVLALGLFCNLGLLALFKYFEWIFQFITLLFGTSLQLKRDSLGLLMPLALSFITFQQIAYLVDIYKNTLKGEKSFLHYATAVCFFPILIAGPITRHAKLLPQFLKASTFIVNPYHLALGLSVFIMGLFKKVIIADGWFSYTADTLFSAANYGVHLSFIEAWISTLSYTFQIYFDFSGYSEMALGLAYCFNIQVPLNFNSPYKSSSIIDFWRSWHMSLSSFLKDYLYIPLGGNRYGTYRHILNILIVMLLGGLWHGTGFNFIAWGALHGVYLALNHLWRKLQARLNLNLQSTLWLCFGRCLTFFAVSLAWVLFRSHSWDGALIIFKGLVGANSLVLPAKYMTGLACLQDLFPSLIFSDMAWIIKTRSGILYHIASAFAIVWFLPNLPQVFNIEEGPSDAIKGRWYLHYVWALGLALVFVYTLLALYQQHGSFIYYQF